MLLEQYPVAQLADSPDANVSGSTRSFQNDLVKEALIEVAVQQ